MKKLIMLMLAPLAIAACGDDDIPDVEGDYTVVATNCDDFSPGTDYIHVTQDGDEFQFRINDESEVFRGSIDEDGDFEASIDGVECSGRISRTQEFTVVCDSDVGGTCNLTFELDEDGESPIAVDQQ